MIANCSYDILSKIKRLGELGVDFSLQHIDFENQLLKTFDDEKNRIDCNYVNEIDYVSFRSIQTVSLDAFEEFFQI